MTWMMRAVLLPLVIAGLLAFTGTGAVMALDAREMFDDPAKEQRARDIGRGLLCLVCQNQSIFDSNASLARDLRIIVRERMKEGDSDEQVLQYITDRYGNYVLLNPPVEDETYVLWVAPLVFLGFGLLVTVYWQRTRHTRNAVPEMATEDREAARKILYGENRS